MRSSDSSKRKYSWRLITFIYVLILVAACCAIAAVSSIRLFKSRINSETEAVKSLNKQIELSLEKYFNNIEDASKVILANRSFAAYNSADTKIEKYDAIQIENEIEEFLLNMSMLDNYCDFCIIYVNDHIIGKISVGTQDLMNEKIYRDFKNILGDDKTKWLSGINGSYNKIFYLRQVNDNAVFVSSFYTSELGDVFPINENESTISYLTDKEGNIILSSDNTSGKRLDDKLTENGNSGRYTVTDTEYVQSFSELPWDMNVITVKDLNGISSEHENTLMVCGGILVCAVIILIIAYLLILPAESGTEKSSHERVDKLTGLHSSESVENLIADKIETCISGSTIMLALVSIENYRLINENYGRAGINEALLTVSHTLTEMFGDFEDKKSGNIVGKTDMNEFVIFADFTEYDLFKAHDRLKESLRALDAKLKQCELSSDRGMIKCAVGAAIYPDSSTDYDELYECAHNALEESWDNGGKKYVLHKKETQTKGGKV